MSKLRQATLVCQEEEKCFCVEFYGCLDTLPCRMCGQGLLGVVQCCLSQVSALVDRVEHKMLSCLVCEFSCEGLCQMTAIPRDNLLLIRVQEGGKLTPYITLFYFCHQTCQTSQAASLCCT